MAAVAPPPNLSGIFPLTPPLYAIPNIAQCSSVPPTQTGGSCWLIGLLDPSPAPQCPQPLKKRRTRLKTIQYFFSLSTVRSAVSVHQFSTVRCVSSR